MYAINVYNYTLLKLHLSSTERFVIGQTLFTPILKNNTDTKVK